MSLWLRRPWLRAVAGALLVALCAGSAAAQAGVSLSPLPETRPGWIGLRVGGPAGASVTLAEVVAGAPQPFKTVTLSGTSLDDRQALAWRCDRRVREIVAIAVSGDGTRSSTSVTVHTPSCARRFTVRVRPRTAALVGRRLSVGVRDGWRTGGTAARVCLNVRGSSTCRGIEIPDTAHGVTVHLPVTRAGIGDVAVSGSGFGVRDRLSVRRRGRPLRLLATGDSMIQIIDSLLASRLESGRAARVTSDARISTGISKPFVFDWVAHAGRTAAALRPDVTVMFIGANDGFPIGGVGCCDARWIGAYTHRVRAMMAAYRRGGAGRVYWLTLPAPRDAARKRIYHAVDVAIERAAAAFASDEVSIIDLVPVFTPGEVYRASIGGQVVRQADGIHLNVAGAKIAAAMIVKALRADGLVRAAQATHSRPTAVAQRDPLTWSL
jgi:lysophospholipase L1-like esterase